MSFGIVCLSVNSVGRSAGCYVYGPCQVADLGFAVAISWQIPAAVMWLYPLFSRAVFRPSFSQKTHYACCHIFTNLVSHVAKCAIIVT